MKRNALGKLVTGREVLLLFLLIGLAKSPLICGELSLFDAATIEADPVLRGAADVDEAFLFGSPAQGPNARWQPLATTSLRSDLDLSSGDMLWPRIGNILLHLGIMLALFRLLRQFGLAAIPSALSVLLLALHPLQVPVLATLVGRSPLLGILGFLLAVLFATREGGGFRSRLAAFAFAALGTLAAPGCSGFAFFPLAAGWAHRRHWREGLRESAPMFLASAVVLAIGSLLVGNPGLAAEGRLVDGEGFFGTIGASLAVIGGPYPALLLWPSAATPDPAAPGAAALGGGHAFVGLLLLIATILLAMRARLRGRSLTALGLVLVPALLLPTTPLLGNGPLPAPAEVLPALTLLVFPVANFLAVPMLAPGRRRLLMLGALVLGLTMFSLLRCWPWRDADLLSSSLPNEGPLAAIARADFESIAAEAKGPGQAREVERRIIESGLERFPGEPRLLVERIRIELRRAGQPQEAEAAAQALRKDPRRIPGLAGLVGALAAAGGDMGEARAAWRRGLDDPHDGLARYWLAQDAQRARDPAGAKRLYLEALDALRGPADQVLAHQVLHQLDYMRKQGSIGTGTLAALARRQLRYAPRPQDRERITALLERLSGDSDS